MYIPTNFTTFPPIIEKTYLQSDGKQYIVTDLTADGTDNFTIECDIMFDERKASSYFFGSKYQGDTGWYNIYIRGNDNISTEVSSTYGQFNFAYKTGVKYNIKMNLKTTGGYTYKTTYIDGVRYEGSTKCDRTLSKTLPIQLFWTGVNNSIAMRFYNAKLYKDGTLVSELKPYLVNSTPCMFDTINGKRYFNSGSGSFKIG